MKKRRESRPSDEGRPHNDARPKSPTCVPVTTKPGCAILSGDARSIPLPSQSVDLVVTSPPYWRKRDYGHAGQIGQEDTVEGYIAALMDALREWGRLLRPTGSVFLNIGDTYHNRSLASVPNRVAAAATAEGWLLRNQIVWTKDGGMPVPAKDRLANRYEYVLHLAKGRNYYYDLFGYTQAVGMSANPGDVWRFRPTRDMSDHLAPFPREIVQRAILLACPERVCPTCREPSRRIVERTTELDMDRPQARRAMELARQHGLTAEQLAAVQAVGVSDAGKALRVQNGTGRNSERVKKLAAEAKEVLGGYFREFTFARRRMVGWTDCGCPGQRVPGLVLDPFSGTNMTLRVALDMGRSAVGMDLAPQPVPVARAADGLPSKRAGRGEKKSRNGSDTAGGGKKLFE